MQSRHAAFRQRLRIEFSFDGRRVIDDAEPRAARQQAEVPRFLRCGRPMNELGRVTFHDAVGITDAQLMFIDEEAIRGRLAFKQSDRSFDPADASDERAGQERDDAKMGDQKRDVMFFPRPAREGGDGEVRGEENEPGVEPGRAVNVGARHFRVEGRLVERPGDRADDEDGEEDDGELDRREELEDRVALPVRA